MKTAKLLTNGPSRTVQLPDECRLLGTEVYVKEFEGLLILFPKDSPWDFLVNSLDRFSDDFLDDRKQPPQQLREDL